MLFNLLIFTLSAQPQAYDLLDQVALIKEQHPSIKQVGIIVDVRDYPALEEAIQSLPTALEVKGVVVRLRDDIVGKSSLYARQSIMQMTEHYSIDCMLVFRGSNQSMDDMMMLKSLAKTTQELDIPIYTSHTKARALGFSGRFIHSQDRWKLVPF